MNWKDLRNTIQNQDCFEGMKDLPDESIDLILTDPPYPKKYLHYYGLLAQEAQRILKPGSFCYAYCGAEFLPEVIGMMSNYLEWFWLFNIKHNGGLPRIWYKRLMVTSKPVVVFTKGKVSQDKLKWCAIDHLSEKAQKIGHEWGQGIGFFLKTIALRTKENDLVLDPFMGSGTTALACKQLNRDFIGFEIDPNHVETCNKRLVAEFLF